jgi:hypothetical protein
VAAEKPFGNLPCCRINFSARHNACDVEQLSELEQTGIGERTHEGFGQCKFGWQVEENPVVYSCDESIENEESSRNLPEPQFPMPPKVIEILKMVAQDTFKKQAEWMALQELDWFKRRFPSSPHLSADFRRLRKIVVLRQSWQRPSLNC